MLLCDIATVVEVFAAAVDDVAGAAATADDIGAAAEMLCAQNF